MILLKLPHSNKKNASNQLLISNWFITCSSTGSVYLYAGGRTTLATQVQKITACDIRQRSLKALNNATLRSFGYSLASKGDLDGNTYNDLAIGAFESKVIFLLRTFSVASITVMLTHIGNGVFLTKNGCNSSYPCGTLTLCAKYSCKSGSCSQSLNLTFTLSEIPYSGIPRLFFTTNRNRTAAVTIYATIQQQKCTNVTYYTETYSAISDVSAPLLVRASAQSLPRTLVTDSNSSLADFKAIPILDSNESIANISILRLCLNPVACRNDLVLNLATVTYRDMLSNVKTSLTLDETAQVVLDFVVSNRGDDIFTIVMTVAGMPAYVNAITFLTDGQSSDCNQLSNNTTFNCSASIGKYLLHNESKVSCTTLTHILSSCTLTWLVCYSHHDSCQ